MILPDSIFKWIGLIGGVGVCYSAGYAWQTVFNTFGALYIAKHVLDLTAIILRIVANVFGSLYAYGFDKIFRGVSTAVRNLMEDDTMVGNQV